MKLALFFGLYTVFAALVGVYVATRLFVRTRLRRRRKALIAAGVVALFLSIPLTIMLRRAGVENPVIDLCVWAGYLALGLLSFIVTLLVLRDLFLLLAAVVKKLRTCPAVHSRRMGDTRLPEDPSRRSFLVVTSNYGVAAAATLLTGYGITAARQTPALKTVPVAISGLPGVFNGFRIVQITDLHVSPTIRRPYVERVVEMANGLQADIVVLTGDLVDGTVGQLAHDVAPLKHLRSARGNYFVTGNHEYYSGVTPWVQKVRELGFVVLMNEHRVIRRGSASLFLAGVTDYRAGNFVPDQRSDPFRAFGAVPAAGPRILLAHQPRSIFDAAAAGVDLQISGHTHGGQFFPWNMVIGLFQPFVAGLHRYKNTQIYVSRGTGYWGPPLRLGAPSEITLIKLVAAR